MAYMSDPISALACSYLVIVTCMKTKNQIIYISCILNFKGRYNYKKCDGRTDRRADDGQTLVCNYPIFLTKKVGIIRQT